MDCGEPNPRSGLEKARMPENNGGAISRRSIRVFKEEHVDDSELGSSSKGASESRASSVDENDQPQREKSSSTCVETRTPSRVDLGIDLYSSFPSSQDGMENDAFNSLQQATQASVKSNKDGRPPNFGVVIGDNIYRSSLPVIDDFKYLETLGLKTILSLVQKDFSPEFRNFMQRNSIRHLVIDMPGTKVPISEILMASVMEVVLNKENYPILVHCNHGKHRTGCAMAVVRHVSGWDVDAIVDEYRGYAEPKVRECDIEYIMNYQVASLQGLFVKKRIQHKRPVLSNGKMARILMVTVIVLAIWLTTLLYW